ncbi:MAG: LysM peptidoglycan-binding domain-containing protein [Actinobacteria bacterium]|nr:LysM peptidoglycan-binding domain-containing protein [Actinomycetota bacterium]
MTERLRGAAALTAIIVLNVGIPAALATRVGAPWPAVWTPWRQISDSLAAGDIPTATLLKALSLPVWVAWAQILVATAVAVADEARRLPVRHLPFVAGPTRAGAARLVTTAMLLFATVNVRPSGAAGQALRPPAVTAPRTPPTGDHAEPRPVRATDRSAPAPSPTAANRARVVVAPYDSLWRLAERHLGDGHRWNELYDLNRGRPQPDGTTLTDPDLIRPGWTLQLPDTSAATVPRTPSSTDPRPARPASLPPAPTASPGIPRPAPAPAAPAAPREEKPAPAADRSPGPPPAEPGGPPPADGTTRTPVAPSAPPSTTPTTRRPPGPARRSAEPDAATADWDWDRLAPVAGTGATVLVAGWAAAVRLRRRRRAVLRRPGTQPPPTPAGVRDVEAALLGADTSHVDWLGLELRHLASVIAARPGRACAQPRLVQVGVDRIEMFLAEPVVASPPGWRPVAAGRIWELTEPTPGPKLAASADRISPMPALVTIGGDPDQLVLLDLEAAGAVALTGDPEGVDALARAMVVELATSPLSETLTVLTLNVDVACVHLYERVRPVNSLHAAAAALRDTAQWTASTLAAWRYPSTFAARTANRCEAFGPTIAVVADPVPAVTGDLGDLAGEVRPAGGIALVLVGPAVVPAGAVEIRVAGDTVTVPAHNLTIPAHGLSCDQTAAAAAVLSAAATPAQPVQGRDGPAIEPPAAVDVAADGGESADETAGWEDPDLDVLVECFTAGGVRVSGGASPLGAAETALVAYLSVRPGASAEDIREALYGERQPAGRRVHDLIYRARTALGDKALIESRPEGGYRLSTRVRSDAELFLMRCTYARHHPGPVAAQVLHGALSLVTGPPFTPPPGHSHLYEWVDRAHLGADWEQRIVDTAHQLARHYLDAGDAQGALWASRAGLVACPHHDTLIEDQLRSHALAGNLQAAETLYRAHQRNLDDLGVTGPSTETAGVMDAIRNRARITVTPAGEATGT